MPSQGHARYRSFSDVDLDGRLNNGGGPATPKSESATEEERKSELERPSWDDEDEDEDAVSLDDDADLSLDEAELSLEEDALVDQQFGTRRGGGGGLVSGALGGALEFSKQFPILRDLQLHSDAAVAELRALVKDTLRARRARVADRMRAARRGGGGGGGSGGFADDGDDDDALADGAARERPLPSPRRVMRRVLTGDGSVRVRDHARKVQKTMGRDVERRLEKARRDVERQLRKVIVAPSTPPRVPASHGYVATTCPPPDHGVPCPRTTTSLSIRRSPS